MHSIYLHDYTIAPLDPQMVRRSYWFWTAAASSYLAIVTLLKAAEGCRTPGRWGAGFHS